MEKIIEKLETIKTDAYYYVDDDDNEIRLTIDDFEGFDEDWSEVERIGSAFRLRNSKDFIPIRNK